MPRPPEEVRRRLEELIVRIGELPLSSERPSANGVITSQVPSAGSWRFLISALQVVGSACGKESPHLRELEHCRDKYFRKEPLDLDVCRGVLEAARDDLDAGMLADLRQLVTAEAFGDLLESAVHLLEERHHIPAVAVAGAVLESSLRTLAKEKGVTWPGDSGISKINTALYTAKVYNKVIYGEIEAWGKLRNQVDHGDFVQPSDIDTGQAQRMVGGVRDFVARYR